MIVDQRALAFHRLVTPSATRPRGPVTAEFRLRTYTNDTTKRPATNTTLSNNALQLTSGAARMDAARS